MGVEPRTVVSYCWESLDGTDVDENGVSNSGSVGWGEVPGRQGYPGTYPVWIPCCCRGQGVVARGSFYVYLGSRENFHFCGCGCATGSNSKSYVSCAISTDSAVISCILILLYDEIIFAI